MLYCMKKLEGILVGPICIGWAPASEGFVLRHANWLLSPALNSSHKNLNDITYSWWNDYSEYMPILWNDLDRRRLKTNVSR